MPTPSPYRGRFAPSPTGPLHFGSLLAAFGSWLMARQAHGTWLVRIEDLDPPREVEGAAQMQSESLAAFGMTSDEPVLRQSSRDAGYRAAIEQLQAAGRVYRCHCSRSALAGEGGIHRACVAGARRPDPALRLRIPDGTEVSFRDLVHGAIRQDIASHSGDPILRRSDGLWAYLLAVVVDDAAQGITHVVRGADLLHNTPLQIHLQHLLGLATPDYAHLPLVLGPDGRKLSKSTSALPVDIDHPLATLRLAWRALGQDPVAISDAATVPELLETVVRAFDPARIPRTPELSFAALHNGIATPAV